MLSKRNSIAEKSDGIVLSGNRYGPVQIMTAVAGVLLVQVEPLDRKMIQRPPNWITVCLVYICVYL